MGTIPDKPVNGKRYDYDTEIRLLAKDGRIQALEKELVQVRAQRRAMERLALSRAELSDALEQSFELYGLLVKYDERAASYVIMDRNQQRGGYYKDLFYAYKAAIQYMLNKAKQTEEVS